jgi:hypothetical protein
VGRTWSLPFPRGADLESAVVSEGRLQTSPMNTTRICLSLPPPLMILLMRRLVHHVAVPVNRFVVAERRSRSAEAGPDQQE